MKDTRKIDFYEEYMSPFVSNYTNAIREIIPDSYIFFGLPLDIIMKGERIDIDVPSNVFLEGHWYDVASIGTKRFMKKANFDLRTGRPVVGEGNVKKMFIDQMNAIKKTAFKTFGNNLVLIGEIGLCYDLQKKKAYELWKENPEEAWNTLISAFSSYYNALDTTLMHSMHWNYTPDNNNILGDLWNLEDFSVFSKDQQIDSRNIDSGGRAIEGFCRPHIVHVSGDPVNMHFNYQTKEFKVEYDGDSSIKSPTVIYLPKIHYPKGFIVEADTQWKISSTNVQTILVQTTVDGPQKIVIKPQK